MAVSYLHRHFGRRFLEENLPFLTHVDSRALETLIRMIERGVNAPQTSSCGRLFDAVAALVGIRTRVSYEAQAAIELESLLVEAGEDSYRLDLEMEGPPWRIGTGSLFRDILRDLKRDLGPGIISRRFHNGVAEAFCRAARRVRDRTGLHRVCLSGGCFQNRFLFLRLQALLDSGGFEVFSHSEVPAGDGGLSLGQAVIAAARMSGNFRKTDPLPGQE